MPDLTQYLPIIFASGLLAFIGTPLTRWVARQMGMVDQPGLRKAHRSPIPLLGGVAMYVSVMLAFVFLAERDWLTQGVGILSGATLLFFTGLWDDRFGLSARIKFLPQLAAAVLLVVSGIQVHLFGTWLDMVITIVWVVGITNAVNFMDNMDGLAAGISAVGAAFFFLMASLQGQGLVASMAAALLGAALGFLFYNFAPAMTFMGDAGSLTLGFLLSALGIELTFRDLPLASTWMAPIVVLGVLIFDTTLVTISRLRRGRSPLQGGSDHTSHRLVFLGLSQPRAVLTLYLAAMTLGVVAVVLTRLMPVVSNTIFGVLLIVGLVTLFILERVEPKLTGDPPLVVVPGAGGLEPALQAVSPLSHALTLLIARQAAFSRAEIIAGVAHLAEEANAVRLILEKSLGEDNWAQTLPLILPALKLHGEVYVVESAEDIDVKRALRRAKLVILGPGDTAVNVPAITELFSETLVVVQANCVWAGASGAKPEWVPTANVIANPQALHGALQNRLLNQAATQAKTQGH